MNAQQFAELSQNLQQSLTANQTPLIPVYRDVLADVDTPLSAYVKLANKPFTYLFESVHGGEKWGRYSIIGLEAQTLLRAQGQHITVHQNGELVEQLDCEDPLAYVESFQARYAVAEADGLPVFYGGLVGYFGYNTVRYVEKRLADSCPEDDLDCPDILLMLSQDVLVFDNLSGTIKLVTHVDPRQADAFEQAQIRLDQLSSELSLAGQPLDKLALDYEHLDEAAYVSAYGEAKFKEDVERVREYVLAGDTMQVVLSQRMSIPFTADPLNLYRALRHLNPSPYLYHLNLGDFFIVGSSPEILARLEDGEVAVRPIAGTRRRGYTEQEDIELEAELLADPKELAEHLMLIDLGRNDVGRVAETGTVKLTDKMVVERYSHVMHIVSNVHGQAKEGTTAMDVLRATLPAGTLSGAPKVRAMEIIDELEPVKRTVYGGAVGYLGWNGNMDTAIAIRTAVIKNDTLYVQAGAGLVADSQPHLEWKETLNKARAIFRAADMATTAVRTVKGEA